MGKKINLRIDQSICTGDGICVAKDPEIFSLNDEGLAECEETADISHINDIKAACEECPAQCIYLDIV